MQPRPGHFLLHPALILVAVASCPLEPRLELLDEPIGLVVVIAHLFEQVGHINEVALEGELSLPPVRRLLQQQLVILDYLKLLLLRMRPFLFEVLLDEGSMRLSEAGHHVEVIGELAV